MNMREARAMVKALRSTEATAPDRLADAVLAGVGLSSLLLFVAILY